MRTFILHAFSEPFNQQNNHVKDVKSILHYGGEDFPAIDRNTNKKIEVNKELSPLDIDKLNHFYPPIGEFMANYAILAFEISILIR